ncbi:MAG TPA: PfkB family carbohydrate kinase, partial [Rectinemataceae bacterium]
MAPKFLAICLNPTIQRTLLFPSIRLDGVNRAQAVRVDASGKGVNVARVLGQSGASAIHLTHLGGRNRDFYLELCGQDSLDIRWADSGSEIRFCTTAIDQAAGTATELVEESAPVQPGTEDAVMKLFDAILPEVDALIVSGTKAAGYSDAIIPTMVEKAAARGLLIVLDIKGKDLAACLPYRPSVVKPNLAELVDSGFLADESGGAKNGSGAAQGPGGAK